MRSKVVTVWPWHMMNLHSIFCNLYAMRVKTLFVLLEPQFLSVPVSTIDYDNLFSNSCINNKTQARIKQIGDHNTKTELNNLFEKIGLTSRYEYCVGVSSIFLLSSTALVSYTLP